MNRRAMTNPRKLFAATATAFALTLAACGPQAGSDRGDPPLAGAAIGGPFELVDEGGNPVKWSDFDGKYRMVYFGYAYCPDVCPFDVQRMAQGYEKFVAENPELANQIVPIFITVDPARDTPDVVAQFTSAFSDKIVGLTGTESQIAQVAKDFGVYYAKGEMQTGGGYLMDHSRAAYLMGREGEPIALLPVEESDRGEAVAAELEKWVS